MSRMELFESSAGTYLIPATEPQFGPYACPGCGWRNEHDEPAMSYSESRSIPWTHLRPGGNEWDETHECPECGTVFTFTNADY